MTLRYGRGELPLPPLAAEWPRLTAPGLLPRSDSSALLPATARQAAESIRRVLPENRRLALVVPDRTRPIPLPEILPPVLDAMMAAGVPAERIDLVPASGIHRPMLGEELFRWVGDDIAGSGLRLATHDADAPAVLLGWAHPPGGRPFPVSAHPLVARAGAVLVLGRIVFHYLAGFGAGRKMLTPGVSSRATVLGMHSHCLAPRTGSGRHPCARTGRLDGNPVHAASCAAAALFPPAVAMHLLLAEDGTVAEVMVGDLVETHALACKRYATAYRAESEQLFDALIVSAGGFPVDRDLVQAHKALDAVAPLVRNGGTIVLVAECGDGHGNTQLALGLSLGNPRQLDHALREDFRVGVHTAMALAEKTRRFRVLALTALGDDLLETAHITRVHSLEDAVSRILHIHGENASFGLAPRGSALLYELSGPRRGSQKDYT